MISRRALLRNALFGAAAIAVPAVAARPEPRISTYTGFSWYQVDKLPMTATEVTRRMDELNGDDFVVDYDGYAESQKDAINKLFNKAFEHEFI